jgi:hypothetical protein
LFFRGDLIQPLIWTTIRPEDVHPAVLDDPAFIPSLLLPGAQFGIDKNVIDIPTYFTDDVYFCSSNTRFFINGLQPLFWTKYTEEEVEPPILDEPAELPSLILPGAQFGVDKIVVDIPTYFNDEVHFVSSNNKFYLHGTTTFTQPVSFYDPVEFDSNVVFSSTTQVVIDSTPIARAGIDCYDCLTLYTSDPSTYAGFWSICNKSNNEFSSDLVFKSKNNTVVTFTDDFESEVLNFTGKHRCQTTHSRADFNDSIIGKVVVATGKYMSLENESLIAIDEAIPIVELVSKENDPRVFGVVGGFEVLEKQREYKLGHLKFNLNKDPEDMRLIINSVGEGAVWVCDINGPLSNGDLMSSSKVPGYAMRQGDDIVRNFTLAKVTCDCDFDLESDVYVCEEFVYDGKVYKKALVGCVYLT